MTVSATTWCTLLLAVAFLVWVQLTWRGAAIALAGAAEPAAVVTASEP